MKKSDKMNKDVIFDLILFFGGWFLSSLISLMVMFGIYFDFDVFGWNTELTLLITWQFGIIGILIILTLIIIFLNRYKIVKK